MYCIFLEMIIKMALTGRNTRLMMFRWDSWAVSASPATISSARWEQSADVFHSHPD
jgi:hypothetical protein